MYLFTKNEAKYEVRRRTSTLHQEYFDVPVVGRCVRSSRSVTYKYGATNSGRSKWLDDSSSLCHFVCRTSCIFSREG